MEKIIFLIIVLVIFKFFNYQNENFEDKQGKWVDPIDFQKTVLGPPVTGSIPGGNAPAADVKINIVKPGVYGGVTVTHNKPKSTGLDGIGSGNAPAALTQNDIYKLQTDITNLSNYIYYNTTNKSDIKSLQTLILSLNKKK
jgi:hypothetical protein